MLTAWLCLVKVSLCLTTRPRLWKPPQCPTVVLSSHVSALPHLPRTAAEINLSNISCWMLSSLLSGFETLILYVSVTVRYANYRIN